MNCTVPSYCFHWQQTLARYNGTTRTSRDLEEVQYRLHVLTVTGPLEDIRQRRTPFYHQSPFLLQYFLVSWTPAVPNAFISIMPMRLQRFPVWICTGYATPPAQRLRLASDAFNYSTRSSNKYLQHYNKGIKVGYMGTRIIYVRRLLYIFVLRIFADDTTLFVSDKKLISIKNLLKFKDTTFLRVVSK